MPIHPDFQKILDSMIEQYGEERGRRIYFSWLNSFDPPLDDEKPMPEKMPPKRKQEFVFPASLSDIPGRIYRVKAIHVGTTGEADFVDEDGLPRLRKYDEDELMRAARTLVGKPVNLNHTTSFGDPVPIVVWAEYNEDEKCVDCMVISRNPKLDEFYERGEIVGASVEYEALDFPRVNGIKPTGIVFSGLAFVTGDFKPGDPKSRVYLLKEIFSPKGGVDGSQMSEEKETGTTQQSQEEAPEEKPEVVESTEKSSEGEVDANFKAWMEKMIAENSERFEKFNDNIVRVLGEIKKNQERMFLTSYVHATQTNDASSSQQIETGEKIEEKVIERPGGVGMTESIEEVRSAWREKVEKVLRKFPDPEMIPKRLGKPYVVFLLETLKKEVSELVD